MNSKKLLVKVAMKSNDYLDKKLYQCSKNGIKIYFKYLHFIVIMSKCLNKYNHPENNSSLKAFWHLQFILNYYQILLIKKI